MAAALGTYRGSLQNRIYECKGGTMSVETAMQMQAISGTTYFAEAVAAQTGGSFVKRPELDHLDNEAISQKYQEIVIELAEWSRSLIKATEDHEIDKQERAELSAIIDEMHKRLDEMRAITFEIYCRKSSAEPDSSR